VERRRAVLRHTSSPGGGPLNLWKYISFRAAQSTRDAYTIAVLADLTFDVRCSTRT
jgi:hypothetical protein